MQLKKLTIQGFKSIGDRLEFILETGITAIVGPNGSGKSNVVDAIRWAVGEQSLRSLRTERLEDIIFKGSDFRRPHGMAEVSLTFTNEEGSLPVPYSEITVTRRAYRSGTSEFYLNNVPCRLRDIQDLFADTGIGKDGYAFIGQGKVDEVLNLNPEQRRIYLEQAAGVWKWRRRKTEAEAKLDQTERDLVRLKDLCAELEHQREPLIEEAQRAELYRNKSQRLKELQIFVSLTKISRLEKKIAREQEKLDSKQKQLDKATAERATFEARLKRQRAKMSSHDLELEGLRTEENKLQQEFTFTEKALISLQGQMREREVRAEAIQNQETELSGRYSKLLALRDQSRQELTQLAATLLEEEESLTVLQSQLNDLEHKYDQIQQQIQGRQQQIVHCLSEQSAHSNALRSLDREHQLLLERKERAATAAQDAQTRIENIKLAQQKAEEKLKTLVKEKSALEQKINLLEGEIAPIAGQERALDQHYASLSRSLASLEAKLSSLESLEGNYSSYYQGPKSVLNARRPGIVGAVAQLLLVPAEYERALETALGSAQQFLIAATDKEAAAAIEWLRDINGGRATFLPLNTIRPQIRSRAEQELGQLPGAVGWADELVKFPAPVAPAMKYLLGRLLLVRDLDAARSIARSTNSKFKLVTLAGDILNPGGSLVGGSINKRRSSQISLARQRRELKQTVQDQRRDLTQDRHQLATIAEQRQQMEANLKKLVASRGEIEQKLALAQNKIKEHEAQGAEAEQNRMVWEKEEKLLASKLEELVVERENRLELEQATTKNLAQWRELVAQEEQSQQGLQTEIECLREKVLSLRLEVAALQEQKKQLRARNREYSLSSASLEQEQTKIRYQLTKMEEQAKEEQEKKQQLEQARARINSKLVQIKTEINQALGLASELRCIFESDESELEQLLKIEDRLRDQVHGLELKLGRLQTDWEGARRSLFETYPVPQDQPTPALGLKLAQAQTEIERLKKEIEAMGAINLKAPQSLAELDQRYSFLLRQTEDVETAKESLLQLIKEIDHTVATRLVRVFEQIRCNFRQIFQGLFEGGKGDLILTSSDPNEAGLEILAQVPGKKMQPLMALSGGERALTAIGFLFALLKCGQSPVCILDEIDAPLDQANVDRFLSYLEVLASETQFITVTHKRQTMMRAQTLYGLAMAAHGSSSLVAVDLSEVAS